MQMDTRKRLLWGISLLALLVTACSSGQSAAPGNATQSSAAKRENVRLKVATATTVGAFCSARIAGRRLWGGRAPPRQAWQPGRWADRCRPPRADVLITATVAQAPYLQSAWLKEGCLYIDMASHNAELAVYQRASKIFTDDWAQIKAHANGVLVEAFRDGAIEEERITGDFGAVVAGLHPGREPGDDLVIFKHIGMAATDVPVAWWIYRAALDKGLGQGLTLFDTPIWG